MVTYNPLRPAFTGFHHPHLITFISSPVLVTFMNLLRRCFECGHPLGKKDLYCPRCGAKQPREPKRGVRRPHRMYHANREERR
jgi:hypothetical protein